MRGSAGEKLRIEERLQAAVDLTEYLALAEDKRLLRHEQVVVEVEGAPGGICVEELHFRRAGVDTGRGERRSYILMLLLKAQPCPRR